MRPDETPTSSRSQPSSLPRRAWAVSTPLSVAVCLLSTAGCEGPQSALQPSGLEAERVSALWWFLFFLSTGVFVIVAALLLWALFRRNRTPGAAHDAPLLKAIALGAALTLVALVAIWFATLRTARPPEAHGSLPIRVRITGHLWWWEVEYLGEDGTGASFKTANELHLPVGEPVKLELVSADVIHSFWVPRLSGKMDLIPGRTNTLVLHALEPGIFRGQCAEFCGLQHAKMAFVVVAVPPEIFDGWLERQRAEAAVPDGQLAQRGQEVFMEVGCGRCHTVRGLVEARARGPDLTHLASRLTLAAGTLPNRKGYLGGWVANPQGIKPGNFMPVLPVASDDFRALLHYLQTLE